MEILYEDKYLIAVNKPAGLVVQGAKKKEESLLEKLKDFIKKRDQKPGQVFLAVVHRLDKPVSGVVLIAKRSKTASKVFQLFKSGKVEKIYLAKIENLFKEGFGYWEDYLLYDEKKKRALVLDRDTLGAKRALTFYQLVKAGEAYSLLLLFPVTGRKHQLRVSLAQRGYPIVGDKTYGSKRKFNRGTIFLHALQLALPHPHTQDFLEIYAPLPSYFGKIDLDKRTILEFLNRVKEEKERLKNVSG
ncbi:pseudouridine synthase [Caldimicrobium thiodismutans]|uniref:Pseudouridine synthase n=1 Tax=Caldimicrobium thiodismutans TaxID=1653476 RepID=A0A0U4W0M0_9BACT|nr:RluA family pseudouridine synthase [Caldimicrobium thiodismutans]BAU22715.1 pseudouridine synthase [Caldimicrobium thiodismutans]